MRYLGEEAVAAALEERPSELLSEQEWAILAFVKKVTISAHTVTRADADAVRGCGVSDETLWHALTVSSLFQFYNAWVDGGGTQPPSDREREVSATKLTEVGYLSSSW